MPKPFTKKELLDLIDTILKDNRSGVKLYFTDREAKPLVKILRQIDKWESAMKHSNHFKITYRTTKGRRYKCLNIATHEGKLIPITKSMVRKLGTAGPKKRKLILEEMRRIIQPQIHTFKDREMRRIRAFENRFASGKSIHVDHVTPFIQLACEWVIEEGYASFEGLPGKKTRGSRWVFPPEIETSWYLYHMKHADLQAVAAKVNLAESSRGYSAPF